MRICSRNNLTSEIPRTAIKTEDMVSLKTVAFSEFIPNSHLGCYAQRKSRNGIMIPFLDVHIHEEASFRVVFVQPHRMMHARIAKT